MNNIIVNMVVEPSYTASHWYGSFMQGVTESLKKKASLNIINYDRYNHNTGFSNAGIKTRNVLVTGTSSLWISKMAASLNAAGIHPVIVCSQPPDSKSNMSYIAFNHSNAAFKMTKYLISLGKKHIAFFGMNPDSLADKLKYEGYCMALDESGIKASQDDIYINNGCIHECVTRLLGKIKNMTQYYVQTIMLPYTS